MRTGRARRLTLGFSLVGFVVRLGVVLAPGPADRGLAESGEGEAGKLALEISKESCIWNYGFKLQEVP